MNQVSNIKIIKRALWFILFASTLIELLLFSSLNNLVGCIVTLASTKLFFDFVFKINIVRNHSICFIAFLQLFLFMYLPLPMTLLDGNEMSHDLYNPTQTYILQFIYFTIAIIAFKIACSRKSYRTNLSYQFLKSIGFYKAPTNRQLWVLGIIGLGFKFILMKNQFGDNATAGAGSLNMFSILMYSPICILFRSLFNEKPCNRSSAIKVYLYIGALVIVLIATNSRSAMLSPIVMYLFGYILEQIYKIHNKIWLSYKKLILGILALFIVTGPASDMATAMVIVRGSRSDMNVTELLNNSIKIFQDKESLNAYRKLMNGDKDVLALGEWDESYVSNIFLDRLCNYRVADATIYHAEKAGFGNENMLDDFLERFMSMYPGPITHFFFPDINKEDISYSPMDKLYDISQGGGLGGFKVGGSVGLGLATFGYFYFILVLLIYIVVFYLIDGVSRFFRNGQVFIPIFTLMTIYFTYFLMFQVANGIISQISFILWGFWWTAIWYAIVYKVVRIFIR